MRRGLSFFEKLLAAIQAAVILLSATTAAGGVNTWTPLGPDGGSIFQVAVDPTAPSTLWAAGLVGAFKSTDRGGHWAQLFADRQGAWAIATHPTTAGTVLVADRSGRIWITINGGTTWTLSSGGLPSFGVSVTLHIVFKPGDPNVVYFARPDGLYKSPNGGIDWAPITDPQIKGHQVVEVVIDPAQPQTVWVRVAGNGVSGVWKSADGGATWTSANTGLPTDISGYPSLWTLAPDPLAPTTMYVGSKVDCNIYKSTDGGIAWTQMTSAPPFDCRAYSETLLVVPGQSAILYAGGNDPLTHSYHLYKSTNSGAAWSNVTGSLWTAPAAPLTIPPGSPDIVYASLGEGLSSSTDAGVTWHAINTGLHGFDDTGIAFDPVMPSTWYFHGSENGIFKTTNGGASFSAINGNLIDPWNGAIVVDPVNPQVLYASGQTSQGWVSNNNYFHGFARSMDGGATWQQVANPANDGTDLQVWGLAVVPTNPRTVFVAGPGDGAFKSTDGGTTFNAINTNLPLTPSPVYWQAIVATDTVGTNALIGCRSPSGAYGGAADDPYRTTNGGGSWSLTSGMPTHTGVHALVADPANRQTVYAGTTNGFFKTTDGGASAWQAAGIGMPSGTVVDAIALDPNSDPASRTIYAVVLPPGGLETVYRSTDGAGSWSPIMRNGFDVVYGFNVAVDPANSQHLILAGRGGLREIVLDPTDTQNKGVSAAVESLVPSLGGSGTGDGNGDGIPDTQQSNVASLPTTTGAGYVTIAAPNSGGVSLSGVASVPPPPPASAPPGTSFPFGMVQFSANNMAAGGCIAVTLYFPRNDALNAYYKYGPTIDDTAPHWYNFIYDGVTGAEIFRDPTRTRIVLHLCDGLRGDSDVMANGKITDPGGPVIGGYLFYTLPPCRVLDTRNPTGPLGAPSLQPGATRTFDVAASPCGIPATAKAISVNLAVTGPVGPGYLTLYPGDAVQAPLTSTINFSANQTRANNAVLPLASDGSGTINVLAGTGGTVDFILDVNGFLR